ALELYIKSFHHGMSSARKGDLPNGLPALIVKAIGLLGPHRQNCAGLEHWPGAAGLRRPVHGLFRHARPRSDAHLSEQRRAAVARGGRTAMGGPHESFLIPFQTKISCM